jgi:hypothetical protein
VSPHSQMQCESLCTSREGCHGYEFIPTSGACKLWRSIPSSETIADKGSICVKYYGTPKPNMARVVTRHLKSDMPSMPYIILRGVGNDLPPRHAVGQGYTNVKFMLENHPDYEGVRTIWVTFLFSHARQTHPLLHCSRCKATGPGLSERTAAGAEPHHPET